MSQPKKSPMARIQEANSSEQGAPVEMPQQSVDERQNEALRKAGPMQTTLQKQPTDMQSPFSSSLASGKTMVA